MIASGSVSPTACKWVRKVAFDDRPTTVGHLGQLGRTRPGRCAYVPCVRSASKFVGVVRRKMTDQLVDIDPVVPNVDLRHLRVLASLVAGWTERKRKKEMMNAEMAKTIIGNKFL